MVILYVDGKAVSWADAEQLFANIAPAQSVEICNAAGRVVAVCKPVEEPVKEVIPEHIARVLAQTGFTLEEWRGQLGWE